MTPQQFTERLERFALRDGMTFSSLIGLSASDQAVVVASIAVLFDAQALYREREVNERLRSWLAGTGANVETDHVNLRRWLVDTQVLLRNDDCTDYRLAIVGDDPVIDVARALDCARIAADARRKRDDERARRKEAWMQRTGTDAADQQATHQDRQEPHHDRQEPHQDRPGTYH